MATDPINPSEGFNQVYDVWKTVTAKDFESEHSLYWHMGNTLDTCVTYLVQAQQKDTNDIVGRSCGLFNTNVGTEEKPGWWRDDYGWWGIAFLNACQDDHASILGLYQPTKALGLSNAETCYRIMNYDWINNRVNGIPKGVRNDPDPKNGVANTITNVLFMMLALRRYETTGDGGALITAGQVFDWFYNAPAPSGQSCGLFNDANLIRYMPGDPNLRAWTGDQGWFWRAAQLLYKYDPGRRTRIKQVLDKVVASVVNGPVIFKNGVVHEYPDDANYDSNFATGPGVFMRQFAIMNQQNDRDFDDLIRKSAQGAADYTGWDTDTPTVCWYPGGWPACPYTNDDTTLWVLTIKTSAQDAFNAYMTVGPG